MGNQAPSSTPYEFTIASVCVTKVFIIVIFIFD